MKLIKTRIRNRIGQSQVSYLMKIAMETPETLSSTQLNDIITVWNKKPRRIAVCILFIINLVYIFLLINIGSFKRVGGT